MPDGDRPAARLSFRDAGTQDVDGVVALVESAFRGEASRAGWTTEADLLDGQRTDAQEIQSIIAKPDARIRLAWLGSELVGCVRVERRGPAGYIGMVTVSPTQQAVGLGSAILAEAERIVAKDLRLGTARMTVISIRTELVGWYERRGWARTGEREPFPHGDPRFGLPRRPDLEFEVLSKAV